MKEKQYNLLDSLAKKDLKIAEIKPLFKKLEHQNATLQSRNDDLEEKVEDLEIELDSLKELFRNEFKNKDIQNKYNQIR